MDVHRWMTSLAITINNLRGETSHNLIRTASNVDGVIYPWVEGERVNVAQGAAQSGRCKQGAPLTCMSKAAEAYDSMQLDSSEAPPARPPIRQTPVVPKQAQVPRSLSRCRILFRKRMDRAEVRAVSTPVNAQGSRPGSSWQPLYSRQMSLHGFGRGCV